MESIQFRNINRSSPVFVSSMRDLRTDVDKYLRGLEEYVLRYPNLDNDLTQRNPSVVLVDFIKEFMSKRIGRLISFSLKYPSEVDDIDIIELVEPISKTSVMSDSDENMFYDVDEFRGGVWRCSCPDYKFRKGKDGYDCKHIRKVKRGMVPEVEVTGTTETYAVRYDGKDYTVMAMDDSNSGFTSYEVTAMDEDETISSYRRETLIKLVEAKNG